MKDPGPNDMWGKTAGVLVPFGWRAFFRKYFPENREHRGSASSGLFHLTLFALGQAGWFADEIFYPGWRGTVHVDPVFILGHQRSGTTYLHRLLASDRRALPLTLQEMLLPSVSIQGCLSLLTRLDRLAGGRMRAMIGRFQEHRLGSMDEIHRIRLDEIEEDEFVFWAILASGMCAHDSPACASNTDLIYLRQFEDWPLKRQAAVLNWYRSCLTKKAYREQKAKGAEMGWTLSKNPAFGQKIPWLLKVFPDARFIHLVRNPLEAIPSRLDLIRAIWALRSPGKRAMEQSAIEALVEDSIRTYLFAERDLADVHPDRKITITHERLCLEPAEWVMEIYRKLHLPEPDEDMMEKLDKVPSYTVNSPGPRHRLDRFGIDKNMIAERLNVVFEKYGFPKG